MQPPNRKRKAPQRSFGASSSKTKARKPQNNRQQRNNVDRSQVNTRSSRGDIHKDQDQINTQRHTQNINTVQQPSVIGNQGSSHQATEADNSVQTMHQRGPRDPGMPQQVPVETEPRNNQQGMLQQEPAVHMMPQQGPAAQVMPQNVPAPQAMDQQALGAGVVAHPPNINGTFNDMSGCTESSVALTGGFSHVEAQPEKLGSIFDPVAAHIPQKIKEKIWKGEFISLSILLKSARDLANESSMDGEFVMRGGVLTLVNKKPDQINNIHVWTSAFIIFMSIVLEKRPNKAQEMLKYMQSVRFAASKCNSNNWVQYDEQYRLKKGNYPESSWGLIDQELWVLFVATGHTIPSTISTVKPTDQTLSNSQHYQTQQSNFRPSQSTYFRSGETAKQDNKCFKFNSGNYCRFGKSCRFEHKCSKCNGGHPASKCRKRF